LTQTEHTQERPHAVTHKAQPERRPQEAPPQRRRSSFECFSTDLAGVAGGRGEARNHARGGVPRRQGTTQGARAAQGKESVGGGEEARARRELSACTRQRSMGTTPSSSMADCGADRHGELGSGTLGLGGSPGSFRRTAGRRGTRGAGLRLGGAGDRWHGSEPTGTEDDDAQSVDFGCLCLVPLARRLRRAR
jgi:hypothetical protein